MIAYRQSRCMDFARLNAIVMEGRVYVEGYACSQAPELGCQTSVQLNNQSGDRLIVLLRHGARLGFLQ
jgi:hypothetical protein